MLYKKLTSHILQFLPKGYQANFYSWIEDGKILNEGRNVTTYGIEVAHLEYRAELFFHQLPFTKIDPQKLMVVIQTWLNEQDIMRDWVDNYEIPFDLDIIDDTTADLSFSIQFREPILANEVDKSDLIIDGQYYEITPIDIHYTAESLEINVSVVKDD